MQITKVRGSGRAEASPAVAAGGGDTASNFGACASPPHTAVAEHSRNAKVSRRRQ